MSEEREPRLLGGGHEAEGQRGVAREVAVEAGGELRGGDLVADLEGFGGVAVGVAGLHGELVGFDQQRFLGELVLEPPVGRVHRAVEEPVAHAERKEVLAPVHALRVETQVAEGEAGELGQVHREETVALEGVVLEGAHLHLRLLEVDLLEVVDVDDEDPAALEVGQVGLEGRRVHCDQDVHGVARRENVLGPEVDLEARHPRQRPRGGADLRRKIGEGGQVVAEKGGGVRELAARDLHAVAGIAGEANDRGLEDFLAPRGCF